MKYFTEKWGSGDEPEEQTLATRDAYWARLEALRPRLSREVRRLAFDINLHDGLIRSVGLDPKARRLTISLRCGDLQVGYFDLDLTYGDVDIDRLDRGVLRAVAIEVGTEALYDEVDLEPPDRFVHRIRFHPTREIEIVFRGLSVSSVPQPDREVGTSANQYREAPGAA